MSPWKRSRIVYPSSAAVSGPLEPAAALAVSGAAQGLGSLMVLIIRLPLMANRIEKG